MFKVKGQGQRLGQGKRSMSNVWHMAVDIRGLACQALQKAITLKFGVKGGHYRSKGIGRVSVKSGHMQIVSQMWPVSF